MSTIVCVSKIAHNPLKKIKADGEAVHIMSIPIRGMGKLVKLGSLEVFYIITSPVTIFKVILYNIIHVIYFVKLHHV